MLTKPRRWRQRFVRKNRPTGEEGDQAVAEELIDAEEDVADEREQLFAVMDTYIAEARRREKLIAGQRKFVAADRTAAVSQLGLMVGEGASDQDKAAVQDKIERLSLRRSPT